MHVWFSFLLFGARSVLVLKSFPVFSFRSVWANLFAFKILNSSKFVPNKRRTTFLTSSRYVRYALFICAFLIPLCYFCSTFVRSMFHACLNRLIGDFIPLFFFHFHFDLIHSYNYCIKYKKKRNKYF